MFIFLDWWGILVLDGDRTVLEVQKLGLLDKDVVYLTIRANRCAAIVLFCRVKEMTMEMQKAGSMWTDETVKKRCLV